MITCEAARRRPNFTLENVQPFRKIRITQELVAKGKYNYLRNVCFEIDR